MSRLIAKTPPLEVDPEEFRRIPLFSEFTPGQILDLSHMLRRRKYSSGEVIFQQGDEGSPFT